MPANKRMIIPAAAAGRPADQPTDEVHLDAPALKKPRKNFLTAEQDDALASMYEERRFFYDCKDEDFKNEQRKREAWQELASNFNVDSEWLTTYVKGLRDRAWKLMKKKEQDSSAFLTEREAFILQKYAFLKDHLKRVSRPRKENMPSVESPNTVSFIVSCYSTLL